MINFETAPESAENSTMKEWTFLIYMAGDNNLNDDMIRAINEVREKIKLTGDSLSSGPMGNKNSIGLIVEFDGEHPLSGITRYNLTYTTPETYLNTSAGRPVLPSQSSSSEEPKIENSIRRFIWESIIEQPARNFCLIFSGHTDAFQGRTLLTDENPPGTATLQSINKVLNDIRNYLPDDKFQILGFDGCVMNSIEVMNEFKQVADNWIGSQGSIPNFTWDYKEIFKKLVEASSNTLSADKVLDIFKDSIIEFNAEYTMGGRSIDIGICKLSSDSFEELIEGIKLLGYALFGFLTRYLPPNSVIFNHLLRILLCAHWNCQTYMRNQAVDITDFAQRLAQECRRSVREIFANSKIVAYAEISCDPFIDDERELIKNISKKQELSKDARLLVIIFNLLVLVCEKIITTSDQVFKSCNTGSTHQFSHGGSMFMPWSTLGFIISRKNYMELKFSISCFWLLFIALYVRLTERPTPVIKLDEINNILQEPVFPKTIEEFIELIKELLSGELADEKDAADFLKIALEDIQRILKALLGEQDTKDNPNRTKGLESFLFYFEKTTNFATDLRETKKICFPNNLDNRKKDCLIKINE